MTSPHIELGNTASDIGSGISSFSNALLASRQKAQQIAMNQALNDAKVEVDKASASHYGSEDALAQMAAPHVNAHTDAQTGQANASTAVAQAQVPHINAETAATQPVDDATWEKFTHDKPHLRNVPAQLRHGIAQSWAQGVFGYHPDNFRFMGLDGNGEAIVLNGRTGQAHTTGTHLQSKGGAAGAGNMEKIKMGASNAANAIRQIERIMSTDPDADIKPITTAIAEGAEHIPVIGGALHGAMEPIAQGAMSPTQQQYASAMDQMVHNAVGLLPGSRQSITLFNNLRDSYKAKAGDTPENRAFKAGQLRRLLTKFDALSHGQDVDLAEEFGPEFDGVTGGGGGGSAPHTTSPGISTPISQPKPNPYGYTKH